MRWPWQRRSPEPVVPGPVVLGPGSVLATRERDGTWTVSKVLAVDASAVHLRLYSNVYPDQPTSIPADLRLDGLGPDFFARKARGEPVEVPERLGVGHVPVSRASFTTWHGVLLGVEPVTEDELGGYREWASNPDAGVF